MADEHGDPPQLGGNLVPGPMPPPDPADPILLMQQQMLMFHQQQQQQAHQQEQQMQFLLQQQQQQAEQQAAQILMQEEHQQQLQAREEAKRLREEAAEETKRLEKLQEKEEKLQEQAKGKTFNIGQLKEKPDWPSFNNKLFNTIKSQGGTLWAKWCAIVGAPVDDQAAATVPTRDESTLTEPEATTLAAILAGCRFAGTAGDIVDELGAGQTLPLVWLGLHFDTLTPVEAHDLNNNMKEEQYEQSRHKSLKVWMLRKKADVMRLIRVGKVHPSQKWSTLIEVLLFKTPRELFGTVTDPKRTKDLKTREDYETLLAECIGHDEMEAGRGKGKETGALAAGSGGVLDDIDGLAEKVAEKLAERIPAQPLGVGGFYGHHGGGGGGYYGHQGGHYGYEEKPCGNCKNFGHFHRDCTEWGGGKYKHNGGGGKHKGGKGVRKQDDKKGDRKDKGKGKNGKDKGRGKSGNGKPGGKPGKKY